MRLAWRQLRLGFIAAALSVGASGCVDAYDGSWVEFSLGAGTQIPADVAGGNMGFGQPPADTHYEFWVATGNSSFKVAEFLVVTQFDSQFPCFIETGRAKYPGLHSTRFYDRLLDDALATGDPNTPDQDEVNLLADAQKRMDNMSVVEKQLKAVVGYDPTMTQQILDDLETAVGTGAPIGEMDDVHNANRLKICQAFFDKHPDFYVGGDKVFSLPLAGHWYGMVEGSDPRSNAPVGGAGFTVPFTFKKFDYLLMNWQFNDAHYKADGTLDTNQTNDPRITSTVDGLGPYGQSWTGYYYMGGSPRDATRRTINVDLINQQFRSINAKMAIFPAINEDDATF
jgi:hypothetical protein